MAKETEQSLRKEIEQLQEKWETLETQQPKAEHRRKNTKEIQHRKTFQTQQKLWYENGQRKYIKGTSEANEHTIVGDLRRPAVLLTQTKQPTGKRMEVLRNQHPPIGPLMEEGLEEGAVFVKMQIGYE
ncbi:hypothetical protein JTB14_005431 [Gonioctena quinquepunctata]|nr:hypothetical protein JTB14_005431 [Gonioctena quinquepunctata]